MFQPAPKPVRASHLQHDGAQFEGKKEASKAPLRKPVVDAAWRVSPVLPLHSMYGTHATSVNVLM